MNALGNIDSTSRSDGARRSLHGTNLRSIVLYLIWAQQAVAGSLQSALAPEQLHLSDWLIVGELAGGTSSLSVLARTLKRDPGSLSRAINRLVERHLVLRVRIQRNRRCMNLMLTPEGLNLHRRLALRIKRLIGALSDPVAQWSLGRLHASLEMVCSSAAHPSTNTAVERPRALHSPQTDLGLPSPDSGPTGEDTDSMMAITGEPQ